MGLYFYDDMRVHDIALHAWYTQDPSLFTNGLPGRRTRFPLAAPTTADPRDIAEAAWRRLVARYPHFTYKNSAQQHLGHYSGARLERDGSTSRAPVPLAG